jgi:hypothetical protein
VGSKNKAERRRKQKRATVEVEFIEANKNVRAKTEAKVKIVPFRRWTAAAYSNPYRILGVKIGALET